MSLLAALVLTSWFLVFWTGLRGKSHEANPGVALIAITSSVALALATFL